MEQNQVERIKTLRRSRFEQELDNQVARIHSVPYARIIADRHFAQASHEAVMLFWEGHFLACVMVTQAVAEGIATFVADRNGIRQREGENKQELVHRMQEEGLVSEGFSTSFAKIQRSFRNDLHHMNPPVKKLDLESLAKRNIMNLATIEDEVFCFDLGRNGELLPKKPLYWDTNPDGSVPAYLRLG